MKKPIKRVQEVGFQFSFLRTSVGVLTSSAGSGVPPPVARNNSLGWGAGSDLDALMQRRNSSLGLSMMNDSEFKRRSSLNSLGPALGLDTGIDPTMPPHRPLVGGGAAAAYEAARADHYQQKREEQQRRASSLGLGMGGGMGGGGMSQMGLSVNPNQHYEMLKLHHMNLLNEIQETTLMMNLYQQQQLQQQQQQLQQQQASADLTGGSDQMTMLLQQQQSSSSAGMDFNSRGSLGLGTLGAPGLSASSGGAADQMNMLRQAPQAIQNNSVTPAPAPTSNAGSANNSGLKDELLKGQQEQAELEAKLQKLKDDIAKRQKEAEELEASASGDKKRDNLDLGDPSAKRQKVEGVLQS